MTTVTVSNIKGSMASNEMCNLIRALYSNIPIITGLNIKIRGDPTNTDGFLEYVSNHTSYFPPIGCETPTFIVSNDEDATLITSCNFGEQLDDIMVHYV